MVAAPLLSKADYVKRYLSGTDAGQEEGSESPRERYKKGPKSQGNAGNGLRIVDDDVAWAAISTTKREKEEKEDGDLPVVAELVGERPEEVKQMEVFCSRAKWKLLGDHSGDGHFHHDEQDPSSHRRVRHDGPDPSPPRSARHDTLDLFPPRRSHHDSDTCPPRRICHDSDASLLRKPSGVSPRRGHPGSSPDIATHRRIFSTSDPQPLRRACHDSPDVELPRSKSSKAVSSSQNVLQRGWGPSHLSLSKASKYGQDSDFSPQKQQSKVHVQTPRRSLPQIPPHTPQQMQKHEDFINSVTTGSLSIREAERPD